MVSIKSFLATSVALIVAFANVEAAVSPSYPSPGTIQIEGQPYDITWTFDGKNPKVTYTIDFMTGSNDVQTKLETVATNVSADLLKYSFVAPKVTPNAAIYFFMFTGSDGSSAWTTRFGIAGPDGKLTKETESTQPNGDAIPWGNGKLANGAVDNAANASSSAIPVTAVVSSSAIPAATSSTVVQSSANVAVAAASSTEAAAPSSASPVPSVAQVGSKDASSASMIKPALTLVSGAVAAYFAL